MSTTLLRLICPHCDHTRPMRPFVRPLRPVVRSFYDWPIFRSQVGRNNGRKLGVTGALVVKHRQQFKRYDMKVLLFDAPFSLIPCHQNCEIWPTVHLNYSRNTGQIYKKNIYIPNEPQTHIYTYMRRAESYSLIHMTPLTSARQRILFSQTTYP